MAFSVWVTLCASVPALSENDMAIEGTIEDRTRSMRAIVLNRPDHPALDDAKSSILTIMTGGLGFDEACFSLKIQPSVIRELRHRDDTFDSRVRSLMDERARRKRVNGFGKVAMHVPGSDVPLPVEPETVADVIGRDPDLPTDIPGDWKRLFLRHYASTLRRVEALDLSGGKASQYVYALDPSSDDFDAEFADEMREIELRYALAIEDRQRAAAVSEGKAGMVKLAMSGMDNTISRKYAAPASPNVTVEDRRTQIGSITVRDVGSGLKALAERVAGNKAVAEAAGGE